MRTSLQLVSLFVTCGTVVAFAISTTSLRSAHADSHAIDASDVSAAALLKTVVDHELAADKNDLSLWEYTKATDEPNDEATARIVETKQGAIYKILTLKGEPLTPEQETKEIGRIHKEVAEAGSQKAHEDERSQDDDKAQQMLSLLPQATIQSYGERQADRIEIVFQPNPAFHPKSHEAEVFKAMAGTIWVNSHEDRLAEIDGHLTRDVKFGGGLLGHLDKGGEFHVAQSEIEPGHWRVVRLRVNMKGKALFFKSINVQQDETHSNFQRLPDNLSLAQGAEILDR